jgi:hypothetical protein
VLLSVAGSAFIQFGFQTFFFFNVRNQAFYTEKAQIGKYTIAGSNIISYEDTVLFLVSNF